MRLLLGCKGQRHAWQPQCNLLRAFQGKDASRTACKGALSNCQNMRRGCKDDEVNHKAEPLLQLRHVLKALVDPGGLVIDAWATPRLAAEKNPIARLGRHLGRVPGLVGGHEIWARDGAIRLRVQPICAFLSWDSPQTNMWVSLFFPCKDTKWIPSKNTPS